MSFFKGWAKKSKGKEKKAAVSVEKGKDNFEDEEFDLPPSFQGRKPDRNLSISRSGRHKMKNSQRRTVMAGDVYAPGVSQPSAPVTGHSTVVCHSDMQGRATTGQSLSHTQRNTALSAARTTFPGSAASPSYPPSNSSAANYHWRETVDSSSSKLSGSQRMTNAPTAV